MQRRHVFYIPGYDPIHPRRYRELYRSEGAAQADISGYEIALSPRPQADRFGWHVTARIEGQNVETIVETLVWSDIVRDSMDLGIAATYAQMLRTAWIYISTGTLFRLMRLRKGPVIAALYPVGFLLIQLLLALLMFGLVVWLGIFATDQIERLIWPEPSYTPLINVGIVISIGMGLLAFRALLRWFKRQDARFFAYYLMHDYAYSAQARGANPPELEARMAEFTTTIADALKSDVDEVLVVGHSSGAHLGVTILSDLIRQGKVPGDGPVLSFLSLGQVVPMVSFLPEAHQLRADLRFLSQQATLSWVDVTAPGDGCAFALCDPVSVTGVAQPEKRWPLVLSAAYTQTLSPERWRELRWRFFRLHFQYLCAFDRPGDYDYFQITAGPMTLADRFAGRSPSKSRIERPTSRYTSVAP